MIKYQSEKNGIKYTLILMDNEVIEGRRFSNSVKAREFFHQRKARHKGNGWNKQKTQVPMAPAVKEGGGVGYNKILRIMRRPMRIGE